MITERDEILGKFDRLLDAMSEKELEKVYRVLARISHLFGKKEITDEDMEETKKVFTEEFNRE